MKCRHCGNPLKHVFLDLGFAPPSNAYLSKKDLSKPEIYFPLKVYVCELCWLVQTADYTRADELFRSDYAYFSSTSSTWLNHAENYTEMICPKLGIGKSSFVIEIASNDGYLLKNFIAKDIPCLGIEPTQQTAKAAADKGIPVLKEFFGKHVAVKLESEGKQADLVIGNNVYAHVPDINDFTVGIKKILKPGGTITIEFQYLLRLIEHNQFDTVYHEHFSYHSLTSVKNVFETNGLGIYEVEELPTHGGSLRVYGCHQKDMPKDIPSVERIINEEIKKGLRDISTYNGFQGKINQIKDDLLAFLIEQKRKGKMVAAYGAAAKGNTLLNYAGIKPDLIPFVCDAAQSKQGKYLPGSHIPIVQPDELEKHKPQFVLILPWNITDEVMQQQKMVKNWGGCFLTAVPQLEMI